ncbi:MBL fold metallo-hydrolase [Caldisalinibacter kiritimatiensis]|uniref:Zn-dependent hydrolase (Beta-lactamase superfamily) n=1 Tax=Caldisalinibacter kiritimatiensis TaxID=1304284 RepID=R1CD18_9FIRM|nr:MBL fold metallo-hydrolase [Caldisalinibacter kiritimatiensis]EOD00190.1 Zn-dependent hydrolase (beta-lactamase superfamily) [Caldisalinibacter kiritimatiensis]
MGLRFCSLASGSSGNCQYIETDKVRILIDAGLSGKKIENALATIDVDPSTIDCILVTHEHRDHTKGVGVLSRRYNLPIYANLDTWEAMSKIIGEISKNNINTFKTNIDFELGDLGILPFKISHDAKDPVAYNFYYKNTKLSLVTDTGCIDEDIKINIKNSDLLMIESNHDEEMLKMGKYPWFLKKRILGESGHLSNKTAGEILCEVLSGNMEKVLLAHLSKENNFPELAYQTVANIIQEAGIRLNKDVVLDMTYRDRPSKIYCFD